MAVIRLFEKIGFELRFKCLQWWCVLHMVWKTVPCSGSGDREGTDAKLRRKRLV